MSQQPDNFQMQIEACRQLSETIAKKLEADASFIASLDESRALVEVHCGYKLSDATYWEPLQVDLSSMPRMVSAVRRGRPLLLEEADTQPDLDNLSKALGEPLSGNLLAFAFPSASEDKHWLVILIRSDRPFQLEDQGAIMQALASMKEAPEKEDQEAIIQPLTSLEDTPEQEDPEEIIQPLTSLEDTPEKEDHEAIIQPLTSMEDTPEKEDQEAIEQPLTSLEDTPEQEDPEEIIQPLTSLEDTPEKEDPEEIIQPLPSLEDTPEKEDPEEIIQPLPSLEDTPEKEDQEAIEQPLTSLEDISEKEDHEAIKQSLTSLKETFEKEDQGMIEKALPSLEDTPEQEDPEKVMQALPYMNKVPEREVQDDSEFISEPELSPQDTPPKELDYLEMENERYRQDVDRLLSYIDRLKNTQDVSSNGRPAEPIHSIELIEELQAENENLTQALLALDGSWVKAQKTDLKTAALRANEELRLALEEVASLHTRLDEAQRALVETGFSENGSDKIPAEKAELIASIAQELRQPLSSVLGYTELLLSESVGILGALQRNFLERVRSSTHRMNLLIEDLIHIAELDTAGVEIIRKTVDLSSVLDDAISLVKDQLQEKRIVLRVDLPRQLPQLQTDRDALQQILFHLLQNADAASPAEGEITLHAFVEKKEELGEFVLIQVTDSGGGILEEDIPRVFSRVYRTENPAIQGVGDTGVGLAIAQTLAKALGGRIWVESEAGKGATFSVLLPLVLYKEKDTHTS